MHLFPASVRYMVLSALCFALMGACVKASRQRGIPVLEILAARALISSGLSYIDIRRKRISPWGHNKLLLLLVGIFTQVAQFGLTRAMQLENAGKAAAFSYVQVIFSALLGWMLFYELPTVSTFLGALFIVGGAMVNLVFKDRLARR